MIEVLKKEKYELSNSLLLLGDDICKKLPEDEWRLYCDQASAKLFKHRSKVNAQSSSELQNAVEQGKAIMTVDLATNRLLGFAQIKSISPGVLEFASLLGFVPGVCKPILMAGALLGYQIDPGARVIAKVREGNHPAEKAIKEMGGKLIGHETSEQHFNPDSLQPINKSSFDISLETLMPSSPTKTILESLSDVKPEPIAKPDNIWKKLSNNFLVRKLRWLVSNSLPTKM